MSRTKNGCVRCDWCGKISRSQDAEYMRPDGSAGYIVEPEWMRFPGGDHTAPQEGEPAGMDICEECAQGHCPACGGSEIVSIRPSTPGPDGWGGRCKACQHRWSFT